MPAKDLGSKFTCFKCGTKFYDLKKPDPVCPKCGVDQRDASASKPSEAKRTRLAAVPKVVEPEPEEAAESSDDEDEAENLEESSESEEDSNFEEDEG